MYLIGIIEYVDVNEENNCLISLNEAGLTQDHTHMEIDPLTILGNISYLFIYHMMTSLYLIIFIYI